MTQLIRLATVKDAPEVLKVTLRAYEPIRELNINFLAATADLQLVTNNIRRNLTYVLEEEGQIVSTVTVRQPWNDPDHFSPYPFIWWFAVDPLYKQKRFWLDFVNLGGRKCTSETGESAGCLFGDS
ncbi:hypothetical protein RCO48_04240 [Peribacillus frigoritolerans]|nr:hypothetical protein [Peribacillus frigoritolerans]